MKLVYAVSAIKYTAIRSKIKRLVTLECVIVEQHVYLWTVVSVNLLRQT
jgi:hypothetical protein